MRVYVVQAEGPLTNRENVLTIEFVESARCQYLSIEIRDHDVRKWVGNLNDDADLMMFEACRQIQDDVIAFYGFECVER